MTLLDLFNILREVGIPVWHYEAEQETAPYIIYQELSTIDKYASGQTIHENIKVEVVHFTQKEFCPTLEKLKAVLRKNKIPFTIVHGYDTEAENAKIINQFDITIVKEVEPCKK